MQCKGPKDAKTKLTDAAKAGQKVEEEDTTCRGRYESHGTDTGKKTNTTKHRRV